MSNYNVLPDYEVDAEGALMSYRTTFAPTHDTQPANVIWRNIVINRQAKRVLCIDRMVMNVAGAIEYMSSLSIMQQELMTKK